MSENEKLIKETNEQAYATMVEDGVSNTPLSREARRHGRLAVADEVDDGICNFQDQTKSKWDSERVKQAHDFIVHSNDSGIATDTKVFGNSGSESWTDFNERFPYRKELNDLMDDKISWTVPCVNYKISPQNLVGRCFLFLAVSSLPLGATILTLADGMNYQQVYIDGCGMVGKNVDPIPMTMAECVAANTGTNMSVFTPTGRFPEYILGSIYPLIALVILPAIYFGMNGLATQQLLIGKMLARGVVVERSRLFGASYFFSNRNFRAIGLIGACLLSLAIAECLLVVSWQLETVKEDTLPEFYNACRAQQVAAGRNPLHSYFITIHAPLSLNWPMLWPARFQTATPMPETKYQGRTIYGVFTCLVPDNPSIPHSMQTGSISVIAQLLFFYFTPLIPLVQKALSFSSNIYASLSDDRLKTGSLQRELGTKLPWFSVSVDDLNAVSHLVDKRMQNYFLCFRPCRPRRGEHPCVLAFCVIPRGIVNFLGWYFRAFGGYANFAVATKLGHSDLVLDLLFRHNLVRSIRDAPLEEPKSPSSLCSTCCKTGQGL